MRRAQSPFKNVNFKRQSPVARYWQRIEQRRAIIEKIAVREKSADNSKLDEEILEEIEDEGE